MSFASENCQRAQTALLALEAAEKALHLARNAAFIPGGEKFRRYQSIQSILDAVLKEQDEMREAIRVHSDEMLKEAEESK